MPHIVLTEDQAQTLTGTSESVEVRDPRGQILAFLQPLDAHEVEALLLLRRRRAAPAPDPAIPSGRVQAMLLKLEEIDRQEGITPEKAEAVVRRLRSGEEL